VYPDAGHPDVALDTVVFDRLRGWYRDAGHLP
jgi:hypothetical protein